MYDDRSLVAQHRGRTAHGQGVAPPLDAWSGSPVVCRTVKVAAQGDPAKTADCAGGAWQKPIDGDVQAVLDRAGKNAGSPGMGYVEVEALISGCAVTAGLERLEHLHRQAEPAATRSSIRRCCQPGDHLGAIWVARTMPWHAHAALLEARSAWAVDRSGIGSRLSKRTWRALRLYRSPRLSACLRSSPPRLPPGGEAASGAAKVCGEDGDRCLTDRADWLSATFPTSGSPRATSTTATSRRRALHARRARISRPPTVSGPTLPKPNSRVPISPGHWPTPGRAPGPGIQSRGPDWLAEKTRNTEFTLVFWVKLSTGPTNCLLNLQEESWRTLQ